MDSNYNNITNLEQAIEVIAEQDRIIGVLTRENDALHESSIKRKEWLSKAKRDLGYDNAISFDVVWQYVLDKLKSFDSDRIKMTESFTPTTALDTTNPPPKRHA